MAAYQVPSSENGGGALRRPFSESSVLRAHFERGVTTYGDHAYPRKDFNQRAIRVTRRWFDGSQDEWLSTLAAIVGADLYLTSACDAGRESAWTKLRDAFRTRLKNVAMRKGMSAAQAADATDETFSDLSMPSHYDGDRLRIGRYTGRGALFVYLLTLVLRRRIDDVRRDHREHARAERSVRARPGEQTVTHGPLEAAVGKETAERIRQALSESLEALTSREHFALVLKYRDGVAQKDIATILDVGAPRVSRLLEQAVSKLAKGLRRRMQERPEDDAGMWALVCDAVKTELEEQRVEGES